MIFDKGPEYIIVKEDPTDLVEANGRPISKWWK